ncbi:response regulator [Duganella qianjiadongensis]|uniref:Response regulator n=1 Tax=Duganella qianjiadongensis TaxID=2692176 RepID=A0ABW9VNW2_9BURK|nr:response regulator [Duganella qianjiadongensis]MYM40134.1 response regulator [Duganella qianjiadongensis]
MKVLVVDDDVVSRMVLMHLIDSSGQFEIAEAEDGEDAWQLLQQGLRPAICFCDLRMPRLSGLELLQRLRQHSDFATLPFVLVTSANDHHTVEEATQSGATGYVVKPFQADQVRQHLQALLPAAQTSYRHRAEEPGLTLVRLGINADRLLVYLNGFASQLGTASEELGTVLEQGRYDELQQRLERLHAGCVTLGLGGAADCLQQLQAAPLSVPAIQAALKEVVRAVSYQTDLVLQSIPE